MTHGGGGQALLEGFCQAELDTLRAELGDLNPAEYGQCVEADELLITLPGSRPELGPDGFQPFQEIGLGGPRQTGSTVPVILRLEQLPKLARGLRPGPRISELAMTVGPSDLGDPASVGPLVD